MGFSRPRALFTPINRNCGRITGDRGFTRRGQDGNQGKSDGMNHLENKLSRMGYHFLITKNGNEIYSNISGGGDGGGGICWQVQPWNRLRP